MRTSVNKLVIHKVSDPDQDRINLLRRVIEPNLLLSEINDAISVYIHPHRVVLTEWEGFPAIEVDYTIGSRDRYSYRGIDHTIFINLVRELQELEGTTIPQIEYSSIENKLDLIYSILRDCIIDKLINCINR